MFKSEKLDEIVESVKYWQAQIAQNRERIEHLERRDARLAVTDIIRSIARDGTVQLGPKAKEAVKTCLTQILEGLDDVAE
jgi:hypothetical protein